MVKEKAKGIFEEYWKLIVEGTLTAILVPYFMSLNPLIFIVGLVLIVIEIIALVYSIIELEDPKLLIVFLITEVFSGGSNNGK
jgi:hypothetical protein